MLECLWLIPTLPLAGALLLVLWGGRWPRAAIAAVGAGSVGLSAALTCAVTASFLAAPPAGATYTQTLWTWIDVGDFAPRIAFRLDALSLTMSLVVTFVGFLIHLYSTEFMREDPGYRRFFAYLNLFVAAMLVLLLGSDLLLLYLGWEGVGLCSYLLIGFWYDDPANGRAARKAFLVTRVGDAAMAVGLLLIFVELRTLDIQAVLQRAAQGWPVGSPLAIAAAALLLVGALGKSAQLPLQTWLPDAMAGPTPVSALIHAATMVTAGVYLIARMNGLFALAPPVQASVAAIGAVTLLYAGCSALTQRDIKRVLAYSTISQIGYMFLALGVGAWSAAIFHFLTHAFFKALLFLSAGAIILSLHHEHDIFKMGGLRKHLPVAYWTFLAASASLAGFPLVTAGFYSKDWILWEAWSSPLGGFWLWAAGYAGAFLTALYIFRVVFVVFLGELGTRPDRRAGVTMGIPLVVLALLSLLAGFLEVPDTLGHLPLFSTFLRTALPAAPAATVGAGEGVLEGLAALAAVLGIAVAYLLWGGRPRLAESLDEAPLAGALHRFWSAGWGFDWLYDRALVQPFLALARLDRADFVDVFYRGVARAIEKGHHLLSRTQSGLVRRYAAGIAVGVVLAVAMVLWT
jgi:NADH-quinone oxidoreductase subunit L